MENFPAAMSVYGTGMRASLLSPAASVSTVARPEKRRERALVPAGIAAPGWGELCPQAGDVVVAVAGRDATFFRPSPGTAVTGGPPV